MHVDAKPLNQYPAHLRWLFGRQKKALGQVLLPGLIWGRVPVLHLLFTCFWQYLDRRKSPLDPALRALVQVFVAKVNLCEFCIDFNALNLLKRTNSMEKGEAVTDWKTSALFSDQERTVLEYAHIMSHAGVVVPPELMARLKSGLSDNQIVELTALVAFQNLSAKFNAALDIPSQGLCKLPG